ncbi:MAG: hypothetical protein Q8N53_23535 [Longimicrobiales bacterium]|nr:hypothetical protein [Longimicrobiales bacterium]
MIRRRPVPSARLRRRCLALGVLAASSLWACGAPARTGDENLQIRWSFTPSPPQVGTAEVRVDVSDVDWTPRNGATVVLTGERDGVTLVVDTARGQGAGRYVAPAFRFEVSGEWILRARVETAEGRWVQMERRVSVGAGEP